MFGGIAFMLVAKMAVGVIGEDLMVRLDPADAEGSKRAATRRRRHGRSRSKGRKTAGEGATRQACRLCGHTCRSSVPLSCATVFGRGHLSLGPACAGTQPEEEPGRVIEDVARALTKEDWLAKR